MNYTDQWSLINRPVWSQHMRKNTSKTTDTGLDSTSQAWLSNQEGGWTLPPIHRILFSTGRMFSPTARDSHSLATRLISRGYKIQWGTLPGIHQTWLFPGNALLLRVLRHINQQSEKDLTALWQPSLLNFCWDQRFRLLLLGLVTAVMVLISPNKLLSKGWFMCTSFPWNPPHHLDNRCLCIFF